MKILTKSTLLLFVITAFVACSTPKKKEEAKGKKAAVTKAPKKKKKPITVDLSTAEKQNIIKYVYQILDERFKVEGRNTEKIEIKDIGDYERIFVSFMNDSKLRACRSGKTKQGESGRTQKDLEQAVLYNISDDRFGGKTKPEEVKDTRIIINVLYNQRKLKQTSLNYVNKRIEPGIHAIKVKKGKKSAIYKESVQITRNYTNKKALDKLVKKARIGSGDYKKHDPTIYKYDTYTFMGDRLGNVQDLYRYSIYVDPKDVDENLVSERLALATNYVKKNINSDTKMLTYVYSPSKNEFGSQKMNDLRGIETIWALTEMRTKLEDDSLSQLITDSLDYYLAKLDYLDPGKTAAYLSIDETPKLGYSAFLILALLGDPKYPNQKKLLKQLAEGILKQQKPDGSYYGYFKSTEPGGEKYYPGEAMLALMKLYQKTKTAKYLESVKKAAPFYRKMWNEKKTTAMVSWHAQANYLLYQETKDEQAGQFIFDTYDWLLKKQIAKSKYKDKIGGISSKGTPSFTTGTYTQGMVDAYALAVQLEDAKRAETYKSAIKSATRFVLQTQITEENSFYLKDPSRAAGAFKQSLTNNTVRNDFILHNTLALVKVLNGEIFKEPSTEENTAEEKAPEKKAAKDKKPKVKAPPKDAPKKDAPKKEAAEKSE